MSRLVGIAEKLQDGHITGIDIWQSEDLSKNSKLNTQKNINLKNVGNKVNLVTADMREMPFEDNIFDILISSFAIHNIYTSEDRKKAIMEIIRVTKNNGKICLIDFRNINEYKAILHECGVKDIKIEKAKMVFPQTKVLYAINSKA